MAVHLILFIFICLAWGISFLLMKYATIAFGSMSISCYRVLSGGLILLLLWAIRPKEGRKLNLKKDFFGLTWIAILGYALPFYLQPWLIQKTDNSAFFGMMVAFVPLLTMVTSVFMLKKKPTKMEMCGVGGGLILLMIIGRESLQFDFNLSILLLGLVSPLAYAVTNTYIKQKYADVSPLSLSCFSLLYAGLLLLPVSLPENIAGKHPDFTMSLVSLLILGFISTGLAMAAFYHLIKERGPLFASMVTYVIPVEAALLGWWLENEEITLLQIICLLGVIGLVALTNFKPAALSKQPSQQL